MPQGVALPVILGSRRVVGSSYHSCWLGRYEYEKQRLFARAVTRSSVVYDIGAHVGFYTLLAAKIVGGEGRVVAFEPLPANLSNLRRHLQLNEVTNVDVVEAAGADADREAPFERGLDSDNGKLADRGNPRMRTSRNLRVRTIGLDESVGRGDLPVPDCLKVDVEGGELLVLQGAERTLRERRPTILLASHGRQVHSQCLEFLDQLHYDLCTFDGGPVDRFREVLATPP